MTTILMWASAEEKQDTWVRDVVGVPEPEPVVTFEQAVGDWLRLTVAEFSYQRERSMDAT